MTERKYSDRLGIISDAQFQAALDHFQLGRLIQTEPIPFGVFGQNVFVSSTTGEYVLRGDPHYWWQFPTEQFFTRQLHERTRVPVPWPYHINLSPDIFGWSFVIMPRMAGLQLSNPEIKKQLGLADKRGIAQALGENMAQMQEVTMPIAGHYNAALDKVEPFELERSFSSEADPRCTSKEKSIIIYGEWIKERLRRYLSGAQECKPAATTSEDIAWVEEFIAEAQDAFNDPFEPCLVMEDYKEGNLVVTQHDKRWQVSGVFDLMQAYFGDGEVDLSRPIAEYLKEDPQLAGDFFAAYRKHKELRPGFGRRFPIYMVLDRLNLWEFFQRQGWSSWPEEWTFRDWACQYTSPPIIFDQL